MADDPDERLDMLEELCERDVVQGIALITLPPLSSNLASAARCGDVCKQGQY